MKALLPIPAAALLVGCTAYGTAPAPVVPAAPAYLAIGTEPGWTLEITPERLNYSGDYGAVRIDEPHGGVDARTDGRFYASKRLAVAVRPGPCSDGMSDRRYAEKVIVVAERKTVSGCGGAVLPPEDLMGSLWTFTHIGGVAVADESRTELRFADGRLFGSAGCNRFNGSYAIKDGTLTTGPMAATQMACIGPAAEQERRLFAMLTAPVKISYASDGSMTLTGAEGGTARLGLRP